MYNFIEVKGLSKTFYGKAGQVEALQDINLSIGKGEIYGIIGMSGAGKSTLVRCLNFLEKPTAGTVIIDGKDLQKLKNRSLRRQRREIAMIFQHFNLLMQKTVLDNICFPLTLPKVEEKESKNIGLNWVQGFREVIGLTGPQMKKKDAKKRGMELLEIVGLTEKANAYPSQLSGGQKQRVAIARALAGNPKILLCDEATSALDPQTTKSILSLLRRINKEFGITIVIITHEMSVVREVCTHVAIVEDGRLAEQGRVIDVFTHPKTREARKIIYGEHGESKRWTDINSDGTPRLLRGGRCIRIVFSENSSFEPVIANMVIETGYPVNILLADTKNVEGIARGEMILGLPKEEGMADKMIQYLKDHKLEVEELGSSEELGFLEKPDSLEEVIDYVE